MEHLERHCITQTLLERFLRLEKIFLFIHLTYECRNNESCNQILHLAHTSGSQLVLTEGDKNWKAHLKAFAKLGPTVLYGMTLICNTNTILN